MGDGIDSIPCRTTVAILHQDDLKKRMNRITATWQKGCFDQPVYTKPNHQPTKMDVLPKTLIQIILAAKWSVRHSSTFVPQAAETTFAFSSVFIFVLVRRLHPWEGHCLRCLLRQPALRHLRRRLGLLQGGDSRVGRFCTFFDFFCNCGVFAVLVP